MRFWKDRNCLNLFEGWSETISIDSVAEEVEFGLTELTFSEVELKRELSKTLKNDANMSLVLFDLGGGDGDIVNVNEHKFQIAQCPVDVALESLTSIAESHRHDRILEQAERGNYGSFGNVVWGYRSFSGDRRLARSAIGGLFVTIW